MKKSKQKQIEPEPEPAPTSTAGNAPAPLRDATQIRVPITNGEAKEDPKKRRKKMSFSTPNPKELAPVRRSKRLSDEHEAQHTGSPPPPKARRKEPAPAMPATAIMTEDEAPMEVQQPAQARPSPPGEQIEDNQKEDDQEHSATKISLPFADTPVIRRNKAMRENKSGKGERRSSLGMRGRRASSLIESGNSNALPHSEVDIPDFYKHIECEGLPEPRRMRQLLTWCATRALDQKPMGAGFEDSSAISAARVIEEELLKELSNRSELSDWFAREDVPVQPKVIAERPNPKNLQNAEKIGELEQQINR